MCDGAPDECIGCIATPIVIVLLPIMGILRIGKYIFYDMPKSMLIKKQKKPLEQEPPSHAQQSQQPQQPQQSHQQEAEPTQGELEEQPKDSDEPQPPSLRIKVPVHKDADIGFTPHVHLRNVNKRGVKTLRWSQDHC